MGTKKRITKDNYQGVALKRSIIACWIILIICFVIKLFGGNYFEIVCTSENFVNVCNYIDNGFIAVIIRFTSFMLSSYCFIKIIDFAITKRNLIISLFICLLYWCFKHCIEVGAITISLLLIDVLDFLILYLIAILFCNKKRNIVIRFVSPIIYIGVLLLFSMISALVKNFGFNEKVTESFMVAFIFMIDYYIMIILTYLYKKRRYRKWVTGDGSTG